MGVMMLDQFRDAYLTGDLDVWVKASGASFVVAGQPRGGEPVTLATSDGTATRRFVNVDHAIAFMHKIGSRTFVVDTSEWCPDKADETEPDAADRDRGAHEAAYDAWFRAEVQKALIEADDPNTVWIDHEDVVREMQEEIAGWRAKLREGMKDEDSLATPGQSGPKVATSLYRREKP